MAKTLIKNIPNVLTGALGKVQKISNVDILIEKDLITHIGKIEKQPEYNIVDAQDCVLYPGFVNTHHHLFQSLLKGVPQGLNVGLFQWLQEVPYRYGPYFDEQMIEVSATIGMVEMLLSGCTTVADHHYLYGSGVNFNPSEILFNVASKLGMRYVLMRGGATKGRTFATDERLPMPIEKIDNFLYSIQNDVNRFHDPLPNGMRKIILAPSTPFYSCYPEELKLMAQTARKLGIRMHSHLSETIDYVHFAKNELNNFPVHWCAEHDWIGQDVSFAHMVHLNQAEIDLCGQTKTGIAHCPQSNGRLGSGIAPILSLDQAGALIGIGVDGAASNEAADMISELHAAWLIHRSIHGASQLAVETLISWATMNGAKLLGLDNVGTIEVGKQADIVLYKLDHPRYLGNHDPSTAIITAGGSPTIKKAWVAGNEVINDGQIANIDLGELVYKSRTILKKIQLL